MNLHELKENQEAIFTQFDSDLSQQVQNRLQSIGLSSGKIIQKLNTPLLGAEIIKVDDSVYSLDQNITKHILIKKQ